MEELIKNNMWYLEITIYIIFVISVFSFLSLAPWLPTKNSDLERINSILKLKPKEKFLEVWCWTSRVSLYLAKKNPESEIVGIELSPFFFIVSKLKVLFNPLKNIKILYWNALNHNFHDYDVVYVFWLPETLKNKLLPKLKKELNLKSRFISYCFKMENIFFKEKKYKEEDILNSIYVYTL